MSNDEMNGKEKRAGVAGHFVWLEVEGYGEKQGVRGTRQTDTRTPVSGRNRVSCWGAKGALCVLMHWENCP